MKIFIATPMYGGMAKSQYTVSLQNLLIKLTQNGHSVNTTTVGNESLITRARNTLVHRFLATDFDALLFIDADHGWDSDDVVKMVESGKDVIGAIYPMKGINWDNVRLAAQLGKENLASYSGHFAINLLTENQTFNAQEPFKVKDIGTGMLFITRKVFEDLAPHCKTYRNNNVGDTGIEFGDQVVEYFTTFIDENGVLLSEDYAFCRMWQNIGGEVWSAPWVKITHSGDYNFSGFFPNLVEINTIRRQVEQQRIADQAQKSTEAEEKEPSE